MATNSTLYGLHLSSETEVVIVGGGVVGVSAALLLAERGIPVTLFEKGVIANEQSSRNWGWIRTQGRKIPEIPLMLHSQKLWQRIAAEVPVDIGYRNGGVTYLAEAPDEMERHETWVENARAFQLTPQLLSSRQANDLAGRNDNRLTGGVTLASDCYAEPALAVPAMAELAKQKGARIIENAAARSLLREGGRVAGVVTELGTIRCSSVILAGGVWSRSFLENAGIAFPQLGIRASAMRTTKAPRFTDNATGAKVASVRPRLDGGYTVARAMTARFDLVPAAFTHFRSFMPMLKDRWRIIKLRMGPEFFGPLGRHRWNEDDITPFEKVRALHPEPDLKLLSQVMKAARSLYPALESARAVESWGTLIDVMPDEIPVIDEVEEAPGLIVASGMSGHGFGLGPGAGMLASQMATGQALAVDPAPYALRRFARISARTEPAPDV